MDPSGQGAIRPSGTEDQGSGKQTSTAAEIPAKEPRHEKDEKKQGYERPCGSDARRILWLVLLVLRHNFPSGLDSLWYAVRGLVDQRRNGAVPYMLPIRNVF